MFESAKLAAQEDIIGLMTFGAAILIVLAILILIDQRLGRAHIFRLAIWVYALMAIELSIEFVLDNIHSAARGHIQHSDSFITILTSILGYLVFIVIAPPFRGFFLLGVSLTMEDYLVTLSIFGEAFAFAVPIAIIICLWRRHAVNHRRTDE